LPQTYRVLVILLVTAAIIGGCASKPRLLMPTPVHYYKPGGADVFAPDSDVRAGSSDVDLLYITDRAPETDPESTLPYGQERSKSIAFGSARVRIGRGLSWDVLEQQSQSPERSDELVLSLGRVAELGRYPDEPYQVVRRADDAIYRAPAVVRQHQSAERMLRDEIAARLERSPTKEVMLYVHGFNETFATAAYTAAELCHFMGREPVCALFTWPASSSGNFLISYTSTTESATFAENHLRKVIRVLATTPGVERVHLLAHSRGTALMASAVRSLLREAVAAGKEPVEILKIGHVVLFSPDIDTEVAGQSLTAEVSDPGLISNWPLERLPRGVNGRLTIYSSPKDRALNISRILFRSNSRLGNLRTEDVPVDVQRYYETFGRMDLILYQGERTDIFGHSYFTSNPQVSSDVIQLLRYGRELGEPGRELERLGPIMWRFPDANRQAANR